MNMRKAEKYLCGLFLMLFLVACLATINTQAAEKASIKLNKTKATIYVGKNLQLKVTVTGKNKKVIWKSSNKNVAVVTSKGKVTAKKVGTVRITAKANGKSKSCLVTVRKSSIYKYVNPYKKIIFPAVGIDKDWLFYEYDREFLCYDIDKNGIPELIIRDYGWYDVYTYSKGKVVKLGQIGPYDEKGYSTSWFCKPNSKRGIVCCGFDGIKVYQLSGKKLKVVESYCYIEDGKISDRWLTGVNKYWKKTGLKMCKSKNRSVRLKFLRSSLKSAV